jgi:transketolase
MEAPLLVGKSGDSLREAFGKALVKFSDQFDFVVFDADIAGGTGAHHFRDKFPERFFQFGIAEQNMMSAAGGFASTGTPVFTSTFAVFSIRAIEQIRLSIAYSNRNVKIIGSHPGLDVGPDGASAQCLEDIACFRSLPNIVVLSPADSVEMTSAVEQILKYDGPVYMRTGRSKSQKIFKDDYKFQIGKGSILYDGNDATIIACGVQTSRALSAALKLKDLGINVRVVNMSTIKPIDTELIIKCAKETGLIITSEDHSVIGGLGSAVSEVLSQNYPIPLEIVGVKDVFGESGEPDELSIKYGLNDLSIVDSVLRGLKRK